MTVILPSFSKIAARTWVMFVLAQRFGKFCESDVLPLHLIGTVAPMSDDFGLPSRSRSALAIMGPHRRAIGQSDERCSRD
jgi:hypothetical protein